MVFIKTLLGLAVGLLATLLHGEPPFAADGARASRDAPIVGRVSRVRDGDTIVVGRQPVRLQGVAAPELKDPLGADAKRFLDRLVAGRTVRCEPDGTRSHDRVVAICRIDGQDLGAALVSGGLARDCPRYSDRRYAGLERRAAARISRVYELPAYCRERISASRG